jgi:hypothetical protein
MLGGIEHSAKPNHSLGFKVFDSSVDFNCRIHLHGFLIPVEILFNDITARAWRNQLLPLAHRVVLSDVLQQELHKSKWRVRFGQRRIRK